MSNVYISCPISLPLTTLLQVNKAVIEHGVSNSVYWTRGTPYHYGSFIETCDAFILMTPNNAWTISRNDLPSGCKRELLKAYNSNRKIFLAYKSQVGVRIYETIITDTLIKGVSCSSGKFAELFAKKSNLEVLNGQSTNLRTSTILGNSSSDLDFGKMMNNVLAQSPINSINFESHCVIGTSYMPNNSFPICVDHVDALMSTSLLKFDKNKTYEDLGKILWKSYPYIDKRAALLL